MSGNLTIEFCQFASSTQVPTLSSSCPVFGFFTHDSLRGLMLYSAQIGYSNGHLLLAVTGFFLAVASLINIGLFYRRMVGASDWTSFNDYQKFHLIFHSLAILFSISWISGFALYIIHSQVYIFMSALTESLVYIIQIIISVIVIRLWMDSEQIRLQMQPLLLALLLPAVVYVVAVASYAGSSENATVIARVASVALNIMNIGRFIIALASLFFSVMIKDTTFVDYNIFLLNGTISFATGIYSILSIVFTVGLCPTTDNISVRFIEWYYLITWMLLDLYFSLTFQKVSQQSQLLLQSAYKLSLHELRQNNRKLNDQPAKSQTSETYVTPLRRFFGQIPSLQKKDSNETIDGSDIIQLLAERQKKARRYYSIASWCGVSLGLLLIAYYLFAIYYFFGHEQGLIQSILITICIILVSHFFFGGLSLIPIKLTRYQSLISRCFGMIYLVAILLAVVFSGDFLIYIAAYLWPICAVLIASDFSRNSSDKKVSLFNPDTVNYQKNHESESEAERNEISSTMQWSFFRFFALTCACGSFFISLFSGLYLPLTFTIVILVCSISISRYLPSNRFGYYSALWSFYIFVLASSIILAIITPVYWGRSTSMISTSFVQKDRELLDYSSSFTDLQGLYLSFQAAKSKSDNHAVLKSWLDFLPASQNRIYFDVRDDLVLVKKIGLAFCNKKYGFSPFFITKSIPLMVHLANLGLGNSFIALKYESEAQVLNDLSIEHSFFSSAFDFRSVFFNPFLLTSTWKRNIPSVIIFDKNEQTDAFIQLTRFAGASFDILNQAERATSLFPVTRIIANSSNVLPGLSEPIKVIGTASPFLEWLIGCLTIPVLISSLLLFYWVYGFYVQLPALRLQEKRIIFGKMISLEKAIQQVMLLVVIVALTGWIIFAVGGASYTYSGNNVLSLEGVTYLLSILGSASCILNYVSAMHKNITSILLNSFFLVISLLGAGNAAHFGSKIIAVPSARLMVTGAGVFSAFQAIGCGISSSRQLRSSLEIDKVVRIFTTFSLIGWILALISVGRLKTDFNLDIEFMVIGLIVSGILAIIFLLLSTIQFNQWLTSFAVSISAVSIFFVGGALVSIGSELSSCTSNSTCSYHISLLFSGEIIYLLGSIAGFVSRQLSFERIDDAEASIISQMQIENYHDNDKDEFDPKGIINVLEPLPETQNIFKFLTTNSKFWNIWRGFAMLALVSWIIFLSGFGSLADEFVPVDFSTAAVLYSLFGPISIFALSWALIRNSRAIMSFAVLFCIISSTSCGRLLCITFLNPFSCRYSIIIGCSGFMISIIVMLGLIFFKFGVSFRDDAPLSAPKVLYILSAIGVFLGSIFVAIGVLVRSDSKDLLNVRLSFADSISSFIIGFLAAFAISFVIFLLNHSIIKEGDITRWPIFSIASVLAIVLIFGSMIYNGSMIFTSAMITSQCSNGFCMSGLSSNILILIGSLLYTASCFLYLCTTTLYGEPINHIEKENLEPPKHESTDELFDEMNIDLYTMVISWPSMQHWLKCCIVLYMWSYFIFIVSFSYLIGKEGLNSYYLATLSFIPLAVITIIQLIFWVHKGHSGSQNWGIFFLMYNSGTVALAFCWAIFGDHLGYRTPIILSSLLNVFVCAFIISGYMSWYVFGKKSISISSRSKTAQVISLLGWILFVVGFILQFSHDTVITPDLISSWIFIILGFILFGFYLMMITWETSLAKKIGYFCLSITLSFGISVFIFTIISLANNGAQSSDILKMLGSFLFVLSSIIFILHKSFFGRIILSNSEKELLLWKDTMSPFERPLHWIRETHFSQFLTFYLVGLIITVAGMFALCASFIVLKFNGNLVFSHAMIISSGMSIISQVFFIYYRWQSFGWSFIISLMLSLTVSGPAIASILSSTGSSAGAYGIVAGCAMSMLGQLLAFFVLISRSNISDKRWFQLIIKVLIVLLSLSWILAIIGLVIGTKLTAAYMVLTFPGFFSIIYLIFVYLWRPKVPKVKSLAEWLGYTIVKKSDLRDALKKANEEHIEVNNIAEDSELSKSPIFGKFKPKKTSVPLIERKTINESFDTLFGSQPVSVAMALISALVYGIVIYDSFYYFIMSSDNKVNGYIYAISAFVALVSYNSYILIVGITAFIDESGLKDSPLKSEENLSGPEAKEETEEKSTGHNLPKNETPDTTNPDTKTDEISIKKPKIEELSTPSLNAIIQERPDQINKVLAVSIATTTKNPEANQEADSSQAFTSHTFTTAGDQNDSKNEPDQMNDVLFSKSAQNSKQDPVENNPKTRISSKWIREDSEIDVEDI